MPSSALTAAVRGLLASLVCTALCTPAKAVEPLARALYRQGQSAEASGDADSAYRAYRKALDLEPANLRYKVAFARTRVLAASDHVHHGERLQQLNQSKEAVLEFVRALEIDPSNQLAQQDLLTVEAQINSTARSEGLPSQSESQRVIEKIRRPVSLKELPSQPLTLSMQEDAKTIYATLGKLAGLNVLFDPDYNAKRVSVQ